MYSASLRDKLGVEGDALPPRGETSPIARDRICESVATRPFLQALKAGGKFIAGVQAESRDSRAGRIVEDGGLLRGVTGLEEVGGET